jgi:hypothetical protein
MDSEIRQCQWQRGGACDAEAAKHVTYNYQALGVTDRDEISAQLGFSLHHADLCAQHLADLREQFGDVQERELNYPCTTQCPRTPAAV